MRRKSGYVQSVDDTRDVTQNGQTDVDQQISTTAALQEDTQGGQQDGEDDLADVAGFSVSQMWLEVICMEVDRSGPDSTCDKSRDEIIQAEPERKRQSAEHLKERREKWKLTRQ